MPVVSPAEVQKYIGKDLGSSEWFEMDQERVNAFADVTLDHQFIHVDEDAAKKTPFGGTIVHGFLTLSMLPHLHPAESVVLEGMTMTLNYGADKLRFLKPVRVGKRIRSHNKLVSVSQKSATNFLVKMEISIEIEGEETPALIYESLSMQILGG